MLQLRLRGRPVHGRLVAQQPVVRRRLGRQRAAGLRRRRRQRQAPREVRDDARLVVLAGAPGLAPVDADAPLVRPALAPLRLDGRAVEDDEGRVGQGQQAGEPGQRVRVRDEQQAPAEPARRRGPVPAPQRHGRVVEAVPDGVHVGPEDVPLVAEARRREGPHLLGPPPIEVVGPRREDEQPPQPGPVLHARAAAVVHARVAPQEDALADEVVREGLRRLALAPRRGEEREALGQPPAGLEQRRPSEHVRRGPQTAGPPPRLEEGALGREPARVVPDEQRRVRGVRGRQHKPRRRVVPQSGTVARGDGPVEAHRGDELDDGLEPQTLAVALPPVPAESR
mmetsp:Transcript_18519/g.60557  ORF Transcript_18519/g.60557 Transcript_18519/m.60557 type:complete len:339 (-) Transcript_18519:772-1788(-)